MHPTRGLPALALLFLLACTGKGDGGDDSGGDGGVGDGGDGGGDGGTGDGGTTDGGTGDGGTTGLLPEKPAPFTLQVSGGADLALYFDTPTCSKPVGSSNFRAFWRDSTGGHVFVLIADLLGSFTGAGTYDTASAGAIVKLQEEAGGTGGFDFYFTDSAAGDSATITVEYIDEEKAEIAWGEFSFTSLHGDSGSAVTATPQPIPIWCDALN